MNIKKSIYKSSTKEFITLTMIFFKEINNESWNERDKFLPTKLTLVAHFFISVSLFLVAINTFYVCFWWNE